MKKLSQIAAVVSLGVACAMPVMAQTTGSTGTSGGTTASSTMGSGSMGSGSTAGSSDTGSSSVGSSSTPSTTQMGAGPSDMDRPAERNDRDMGWIGLLGLAGLLGLRRKHHDHDRTDYRTNTAR